MYIHVLSQKVSETEKLSPKNGGEHVVSEVVCVRRAWNTRNNGILWWSVTRSVQHTYISTRALVVRLIISSTVTGVTALMKVKSGRKGTFRVQCTSYGGGGLNVSVTGASNFSTNIRRVIDSNGVGKDTYFATTDIISGGNDGDMYQCTASNGVSSKTNSVQLRGY